MNQPELGIPDHIKAQISELWTNWCKLSFKFFVLLIIDNYISTVRATIRTVSWPKTVAKGVKITENVKCFIFTGSNCCAYCIRKTYPKCQVEYVENNKQNGFAAIPHYLTKLLSQTWTNNNITIFIYRPP